MLANADDRFQIRIQSGDDLLSDIFVGFMEDISSFTVSDDYVIDIVAFE